MPQAVNSLKENYKWGQKWGDRSGDGGHFNIRLRIDGDASPGTELVNTAEISYLPDEDYYGDNIATVVETLYDHGPNLRVRKSGGWHGHGATGHKG